MAKFILVQSPAGEYSETKTDFRQFLRERRNG